jgi:NADPH2:quinone reductase
MTTLPNGRRVVISQFGETPLEAIDQFASLEPMSPPDLGALKPDELVIAVKSASVNWVDMLMTSGQYQHMAKPPYTPGLEAAGLVAWIGPAVEGKFAVGDRVFSDGLLVGPRSLGDYQRYGGYASYIVAPAHAVHGVPEIFSFDQACNLLGNYETAYHCLVVRGRLQAGETVLIHGASGSTGLAAVQIAKQIGATVIATGRSDAKLKLVKDQGADFLINLSSNEGEGAGSGIKKFRDEVKALTQGHGVEVVYDGVGGEISLESLRCVAFGARYLIVGWAATPFVANGKGQRGAPNANQLPTNLILMKGLDVLGSPMAISTAENPAIRAPRLAQILRWAHAGKINPFVSHTFPIEQFQEAMRAKWSGAITGGCALRL